MSLRPHATCTIHPTVGVDIYGKEQTGPSYTARCAVVKLAKQSERTSVRTDSSASRGAAHEITADARLLFQSNVTIKVDDKVEIMGFTLKVVSVFPRLTVGGRHDHNQVDLNIWA